MVLAAKRWKTDINGTKHYFIEDKARLMIDWVQTKCRHWEGSEAGKLIKLEAWQIFYFANLFGWYREPEAEFRSWLHGASGPETATRDPGLEEVSPEALHRMAESLGQAVTALNRGVRFRIDESGGTVVAQIVDRETDQVIRQIPPEELLAVSQRLRDFLGLLLDF